LRPEAIGTSWIAEGAMVLRLRGVDGLQREI
jgi:hypothetical protein